MVQPEAQELETGANSGLVRIGVDIGGTFTDFIVLSGSTGAFVIGKRLTTPADPSEAVLSGLADLMHRHALRPEQLEVVVHATTLVTNTVIERTGAKTGLITTHGFRDVLEIGTESRYDLYDLFLRAPDVIVPRHLRKTVEERVGPGGTVLVPASDDSIRAVIGELLDASVEAIAVCLLHAYANPAHERRVLALVEEMAPGLPVTLSSALLPEIREYERMVATAINAYVQPKVRGYLGALTAGLERMGIAAPLYIMQSSGGLTVPSQVAEAPVAIIESGPAAGAVYASYFGRAIGLEDLISFDMGGTTAKTCVISAGAPSVTVDIELARLERFKKGSGLPVRVPSIELIEVGAGGGSIAWIDSLGLLKVGPRSAGASPGPACYGRGGREATVTDADLLLGFLDREYFLGGEMRLDVDAARQAVERVAEPLGLSVVEAAWGIHDIVNETMALSSRTHIIERDEDPRSFALIAFGGAGPVHAQGVASKLGIRTLIFPIAAGAASALGLLVARPSADHVQSYVQRLRQCDWSQLEEMFGRMHHRASTVLSTIAGTELTSVRSLDCRYAGQGYDLNVEVPSGVLSADSIGLIEERFHAAYERRYGRRTEGAQLDVMNLRTTTRGEAPKVPVGITPGRAQEAATPARTRAVYFGPRHGYIVCAVQKRASLKSGARGDGPAIIEERESTIVVGPGQRWRFDDAGNVVLDLTAGVGS